MTSMEHRWASRMWVLTDKELGQSFYKSLHVGLASERNALDILVTSVTAHIDSIVWSCGADDDRDDVLQLWLWLDMPPEVAADLATLSPRRINGELHCDPKVKEEWDEPVARIANVLICVWRFRLFTESRFATLGPCLRI